MVLFIDGQNFKRGGVKNGGIKYKPGDKTPLPIMGLQTLNYNLPRSCSDSFGSFTVIVKENLK